MPFDGAQINETAARLIKAKELIRSEGWCPDGAGNSGTGPRCVVTAIDPKRDIENWRAFLLFAEANALPTSIGLWNDSPGRTLDKIYAAFDRAIALSLT